MFSKIRKQTKGFTIIEVLIVLAIAGLIMMIVFLAVPALQRNSHNSARNGEAARVSASVTECLANRNGQTSSCNTSTTLGYGTLNEFTGVSVSTVAGTAPSPAFSTTQVGVWYGNICTTDGSAQTTTGATSRSFAVLYQLDGPTAITRCIGS